MKKTDEEALTEIDTMDELHLYFFIDFVGAFTWRMGHDYGHGRISEADWESIKKDSERLQKQQARAVQNLTRFGVKSLNDDGRPTDEYRAWYSWWSHWHKDEMSNEEWRELDSKMVAKEDVSTYRPKGDWRTLLTK